jgi:hypothetical protein
VQPSVVSLPKGDETCLALITLTPQSSLDRCREARHIVHE